MQYVSAWTDCPHYIVEQGILNSPEDLLPSCMELFYIRGPVQKKPCNKEYDLCSYILTIFCFFILAEPCIMLVSSPGRPMCGFRSGMTLPELLKMF